MAVLKRIGVFVCHCGLNIASSVDVKKVVEEIRKYPGVVHAEDYIYMCSDPGQDRIRKAIKEKNLDGIVNCNCSPSLHEKTFRNLASSMGINPYHVEIANIREQCSWPHVHSPKQATEKAIQIIEMTIEKLKRNMELFPEIVPLTKEALVIGGGIAGMQAALDIANAGYKVVLVEKTPQLGGHLLQLSDTFPYMDKASCLVRPLIEETISHPNIEVMTNTEIYETEGYVGNFNVTLKQYPRYVNIERCDGCSRCVDICPVSFPSEFYRNLKQRKAIDFHSPIGSPNVPDIKKQWCLHFTEKACSKCKDICPQEAIDFSSDCKTKKIKVGAIIVATGYELYQKEKIEEYQLDRDIIDSLQFELLVSDYGPTEGKIIRPSDGRIPKEIVFIQCTGSRDPEHHLPYCSRICCMYTAKQAAIFNEKVPDGQAYIFYIDIRSDAKDFEEFVKEIVERHHIIYLRGRVSKVFRENDKLVVLGTDTLSGKTIEIKADMVVLAMAMVPSIDAKALSRKLNIISDNFGFMSEAHIKLRPVETLTSGIFLAGTCQAPRDISDTISSASAAASKVLSLFSRKELLHEPEIAWVDEDICVGCGYCVSVCAYKAPEIDPRKKVARINEALCEGCGACQVACPSGAMQHKNYSTKQFFDMIDLVATK